MSTATAPAPMRGARTFESLAWVGLLAGLLLIASASCVPARADAPAALYAAGPITPEQFTAWVQAIAAAIGTLTAAANGVAILVHRWGRPPRRRRKPAARPESEPLEPRT